MIVREAGWFRFWSAGFVWRGWSCDTAGLRWLSQFCFWWIIRCFTVDRWIRGVLEGWGFGGWCCLINSTDGWAFDWRWFCLACFGWWGDLGWPGCGGIFDWRIAVQGWLRSAQRRFNIPLDLVCNTKESVLMVLRDWWLSSVLISLLVLTAWFNSSSQRMWSSHPAVFLWSLRLGIPRVSCNTSSSCFPLIFSYA